MIDCPICFDQVPEQDCVHFNCDHDLCKECWEQMKQRGDSTRCPYCRTGINKVIPTIQHRTIERTIAPCVERFNGFLERAGLDRKHHQVKGIEWCLKQELIPPVDNVNPGGIIADEMGLGKTILALGLIRSNFLPRTLIVLPVSLIPQWTTIIQKFFKHTPVVFHGADYKQISQKKLEDAPIVITSYGMISMMKKDGRLIGKPLHKYQWDRVIYDESHNIRNKNNKSAGAINLKAKISWFITGTPIHNTEKDVKTYFNILGIPMTSEICDQTRGITLRRTKAQVGIRLPEISFHERIVDWNNETEYRVAENVHLDMPILQVNAQNVHRIIRQLQGTYLGVACRARQSCILTSMLTDNNDLVTDGITTSVETSSKLDAVIRNVLSKPENKCIIFSFFRKEIDYLVDGFGRNGVECDFIDGRKSYSQRNEIIQTIKPRVLVLQFKTNCEGLNLQEYQDVHFTSTHWNPALEDQAIARCHRIGQTKPVSVWHYYMRPFLTANGQETPNFEMVCREIQNSKRRTMRRAGFVSSTPISNRPLARIPISQAERRFQNTRIATQQLEQRIQQLQNMINRRLYGGIQA